MKITQRGMCEETIHLLYQSLSLTWIYYPFLQLVIPDPIPDLPSVRGREEEKEQGSENDLHRRKKKRRRREAEVTRRGRRASLNGKWSRSEAKSGSFR